MLCYVCPQNKNPVIIFNFDLDSFKQINDTQGHHVGDEVLNAFVDILKRVFSQSAFVGRMGGDEFIVVADYEKKQDILQGIKQMQFYMNEYNTKHPMDNCKLSASYGLSDNHDQNDLNIWKVYEMADQRMYQSKISKKTENASKA